MEKNNLYARVELGNFKLVVFWLVFLLCSISVFLLLVESDKQALIFYLACLVFSVFFANISRLLRIKSLKFIFAALSFSILFVMYGLRDISGIDDPAYERIYTSVAQIGWLNQFRTTGMEPGYLFLNSIFSFFSIDYIYFQIFVSFVSIFIFYYSFYKDDGLGYFEVYVLFLFCMLMMQIQSAALVRMFLAMSIVSLAYKHIAFRESFKYFSLICIAATFHYSALFLLFFLIFSINKSNLRKRALFFYVVASISMPVVMFLLARFLIPSMGDRYQGYAENTELSMGSNFVNTLPLILIFLLSYHNIFKRNFSDLSLDFKKDYYKFLLFVYSVCIIIALFSSLAGLGRLIFYFYVAFIMLASFVFKNVKSKLYALVAIVPLVLYAFLYVYRTQFINEFHIPYFIPYKNIFFTIN